MSSLSVESIVVRNVTDLDRLIGLCEEISALVRTGLPIEESLFLMGRVKRGRVGQKLQELATTLGTGKSLVEAVRNDPSFPPVFAAVVEAGLESGNLAGALDSLSESVRSLRDTRLFLMRSSLYPLIMFTSLWLVFSLLILYVAPKLSDCLSEYGMSYILYDIFQSIRNTEYGMWAFTLGVPAVVWLKYCFWGYSSARNHVIQSAGSFPLFCWIPWIGPAAVELQKATFAKILSTLLRSSLPLDKALLLAAQASNDRYWGRENIDSLRERIVQGVSDKQARRPYPKSVLSPLIEWSLGITNQQMLLEGIDHYAKIARTRADLLFAKCEMFLPAFLTFVLAVLIGSCYFMTVLWPYIHILNVLAEPTL